MTSRYGFTRVGLGVLWGLGLWGLGVIAAPSYAQSAEAQGKASARMTTVQPTAASHAEPPGAKNRSQIGIGLGLFTESSERRDEAYVGGQQFGNNNNDAVELESDGIVNVQAWYLRPIWVDGLRWGGGVSWFNKYGVLEADNEDDDQEPYVFGHMFQVGLQGEYELERVASKLGVLFGLRGGGALLFPSDNLRQAIEDLDRRGFDVWQSPQFGLYIAPLVGVRWPLSERVAVRADLSVQFSKLWLYDAEGEARGITSEIRASLGTTRTQMLLGLDFGL